MNTLNTSTTFTHKHKLFISPCSSQTMIRWALIIQNSIFIFTQTGSEKVWLTDKQWCTKDKGIVIYRRGHAFCCEMPPCWAKGEKKKMLLTNWLLMEMEVLSKPLIEKGDSYIYSHKVNIGFYDCSGNTQPSKSSHLSAHPVFTSHRLPGFSSLSTSPLPVRLGNTCDMRDLEDFSFTWNSNMYLLLLFWMDVGMIASPLTLL